MVRTYFTSDSHFGHPFIAEHRGFTTYRDHDNALIKTHNSIVQPHDIIFHLGDVGMARTDIGGDDYVLSCIEKMHGTFHLYTGNHDSVHPMHRDAHKKQARWMRTFASVQAFGRRKIAGRDVMISHFPYTGDHGPDRHVEYRLPDHGHPILCGHVHDEWAEDGHQINVGVDVRDFRPISIEAISDIVRSLPKDAPA